MKPNQYKITEYKMRNLKILDLLTNLLRDSHVNIGHLIKLEPDFLHLFSHFPGFLGSVTTIEDLTIFKIFT